MDWFPSTATIASPAKFRICASGSVRSQKGGSLAAGTRLGSASESVLIFLALLPPTENYYPISSKGKKAAYQKVVLFDPGEGKSNVASAFQPGSSAGTIHWCFHGDSIPMARQRLDKLRQSGLLGQPSTEYDLKCDCDQIFHLILQPRCVWVGTYIRFDNAASQLIKLPDCVHCVWGIPPET